jgi:DUF1009 family protein
MTIGLIAGGGRFPMLFADSARRAGHRVVAVGFKAETDPALASHVDAFSAVKLGQFGAVLQGLREGGASGAVMLGSITKRRFFADIWPDAAGVKILARVAVKSDDNLLRAIARWFEEEGLPILDATPFLVDRLAPEGVLGQRRPDDEQREDAVYGMALAREIGRLDVGQTVVVKQRVAVAVECIEGTDACIRRGGELCREGAVVCKVVKPGQDRRFDLPAVGPDTLETMREVKARVLAVEAGGTLCMDLPRMVELADRAGIVLLGVK